MKIEQDDIIKKKDKNSSNKTVKMILILIFITLVILIGIIIMMTYIGKGKLSVSIDGQSVAVTEDTFIFTETTGEIYVSIKDIAPLVGYESHNGEYKINSEDTSKMYVEAKDATETTSFYLNSTLINKVAPDSTDDYENIEISSPVTMINQKWYINAEGFMKAFNSIFSYNKESNKITIQTLPYLVEYYEENIENYGYDELSDDFKNQKALVYGMIVASKSSTKKYGVIDSGTKEEIISPRYNNIEFIESSNEFIITNASNKVGIAYSTGETKINVLYDEIKVLNSNLEYYLVKSNSKYGVINAKEEPIIHIEYDEIGVDTTEFLADNISNQYMLYDTLIPVSINDKWGFFDKDGKKITEVEYDTIGCINKDLTDKTVNNAMIVADSEVVIVSKEDLYGGVSTRGDLLLPIMFEYVYSITSEGETTYYVVYQGKSYNALDYINRMKERLGYNEEDTEEDEDTQNNESNNNSTITGSTVTGIDITAENNEQVNNSNDNPDTNQNSDNNNQENPNHNNTPDATNDEAANIFNSAFEAYAGEHSKNTIISLIDSVSRSNLSNDNKIQIEHNGSTYVDNFSALREVLTNPVYTISIEYNQETKYIQKIVIK